MRWISVLLALVLLLPVRAVAAVGCDLNDPDRDVKRLFPGSTSYKTFYRSIDQAGGPALLDRIEQRLGDTFSGLFETADVPYTIYEVYQDQTLMGYIHGVNQKGQYGGLQVFLSLDPHGVIRTLYYQKLTSRQAGILRQKEFGARFAGLSLKDLEAYDVRTGRTSSPALHAVRNPAPQAERDFRATLRAVKKNLILMDEFVLKDRRVGGPERAGEVK